MTWYEFSQNNSGGSFDYNAADGITHKVFIEAENADGANAHALYVGIYFNGCQYGSDCPCCGDRWYPVEDDNYYVIEAGEVPEKDAPYDKPFKYSTKWMKGFEYFVHPLEGDFYGAGV